MANERSARLRKPRIAYTPSPAFQQTRRRSHSDITMKSSSVVVTTSPTPSLKPGQLAFTFSPESFANNNLEIDNLVTELPDNESGKMAKKIFSSLHKVLVQEFSRLTETLVSNLASENKKLKLKVEELEKELESQKSMNTKCLNDQSQKTTSSTSACDPYKERIIELEKNSFRLEQYGRRNNVEFAGIPETVSDEALENKMIELLSEINVKVNNDDIEACHRLGKLNNIGPRRVIIRFVNRKKCFEIFRNKSARKDIDKAKHDLGSGNIYANYSLCKAYGTLWYHCKKLHAANHIDGFWVSNGSVRLKVGGSDSHPVLIEYQSELDRLFPTFDFGEPIVAQQKAAPSTEKKKGKKNRKNK